MLYNLEAYSRGLPPKKKEILALPGEKKPEYAIKQEENFSVTFLHPLPPLENPWQMDISPNKDSFNFLISRKTKTTIRIMVFKRWCVFRSTQIRYTPLLTYTKSIPTYQHVVSCYNDQWPERPVPQPVQARRANRHFVRMRRD